MPPLEDAGDSGMIEDAGPDGGADAGPDAGPDAGIDAGPDAGPDAGQDAGALGPQFGTPVVTAETSLASQLASGDFDGDGKLDLADSLGAPSYDNSGNVIFTGASVNVRKGNGDGTFQAAVALNTGGTPHGIALLDVDGDGRLDIVVGVCQSGNDHLSYFLNKGGSGASQFGPRHDVPVSKCPWSLAVVPGLSGGGRAGVATAGPGPYWLDAGTGEVDTLVADDGGLRIAQTLTTTKVATSVFSADLNADGVPDLAATTSSGSGTGNSLALMWLGGNTGFQPVVPSISLDHGPYRAIAVGDIDGNGIADLALASADTATLAIVPGQGNSSFGTVSYQGVSSSPVDLAVADFRKIGTLDIAAATSGYPFVGVSVFPGAASGGLAEMSVLSDGPASGITAGDFNGDGLPDIAVSLGYLGGIAVIPSLFQAPFLPDPITYQVADHVPIPPCAYNGGPVLTSPQVVTLTFRGDAHATLYQQFDEWMVGSEWFATIGADYGVSNGTNTNYTINETAPATLGDSDVQVLIERLILDGGLTPPQVDDGGVAPMQLYMIYFPYGTTIADSSIGTSCRNFGAYHSEDSAFTTPFAYGVMPTCYRDYVYYTEVSASHELAEASTDPFVGGAPGSPTGPAYTNINYNNGWVGEVGDNCEPFDTGYVVDGGTYYAVQRVWSNSAADAGKQPCIPAVDMPYANVSPGNAIPTTCYDPSSPEPCTSVYYPVTPGSSFELTFTGWTDRPAVAAGITWAPYAVAGLLMPSFSPIVTLDKYNLRNGEQVHVTVDIPSGTPSQSAGMFTLISGFDNGNYAYWPVVVLTP
jgi:hypothetical protein